jgi:hypothetical protein
LDDAGVFHTHAHPDIRRPRKLRRKVHEPFATFGKHLKSVVWAIAHCLEYTLDIGKWDIVVKEVAHRIYKHDSRLSPAARNVEQIGVQRHLKAVPVAITPHGREALCHALSVAVFATLTDLGTPRDGIPGHLGPLDVRLGWHGNYRMGLWFETRIRRSTE